MAESSSVSSGIEEGQKKADKKAKVAILVLMGLPGSGKTTLATALSAKLTDSDFEVFTVTYDAEISHEKQKELAVKSDEQAWKAERKVILAKVDKHLENVGNEAKELTNHVIIIDDNNYYSSMRHSSFPSEFPPQTNSTVF